MELVKLCRKTGIKVPVKIPSNLDGNWNNMQKHVWAKTKVELQRVERRLYAARRRATNKSGKVPVVVKVQEGHTEGPETLAASRGKKRITPSQPPFTNEDKARLVHCIASPEFRSCVEIMLKGVSQKG